MAAFDPKVFAGSLTQRPGAYQMIDDKDRVIYVGKARNLRRRVASYFGGRPHDAKTMAMVARVADIRVTVTATEADALMLEYNLIKRHKPRFNVVLRDDKSYPYIRVRTDKEFPQVSFYRGSRRAAGRLFGPYPSAGSVRATLGQLQKLFQVRQCEDSYFSHRQRPCLQFQIQRCTAPCVGLVSAEDYRRDIEHAMMFLQGRSEAVTEVLVERMEDASERLDFERAAQYRDQIARLKSVEAQQLVTRSRGDLDAVGLVSDGGVHCVAVMSFRGGRMLGSRSHYPRAAADTTAEEIMRGFLLQYYGRREPPHEIRVSHAASDADALAELFETRARRRVPDQASGARRPQGVDRDGADQRGSRGDCKEEIRNCDQAAVQGACRQPRVERNPPANGLLRREPHQRRVDRGFMRCLRLGRACQVRVPPVQYRRRHRRRRLRGADPGAAAMGDAVDRGPEPASPMWC